jgi:hypothetical protein
MGSGPDNGSRKDIRRILKTFGIRADEAMVAHLARNPQVERLQVRLILEDMTDYGAAPPDHPLTLTVEDTVARVAAEEGA